jgi:hypothetical protein
MDRTHPTLQTHRNADWTRSELIWIAELIDVEPAQILK